MRSSRLVVSGAIAIATIATIASFTASPAIAAPPTLTTLDRTVARFSDPEAVDATGGVRFVMMRELILEAWLAAYERSPGSPPSAFDDKALRTALERHVIEEVLSQRLPSSLAAQRLPAELVDVRAVEAISVGGDELLSHALRDASGGGADGGKLELDAVLQRRARAQLYLELTVAQQVELNEAELRAAYVKAPDVLSKRPFEQAAPGLRAYVRAQRLREAAQAYYQAVRTRLRLEIVPD